MVAGVVVVMTTLRPPSSPVTKSAVSCCPLTPSTPSSIPPSSPSRLASP
uniref:Uncharacterized protein n=1 Tax=Arundo donax TaxID=35708 RepID=A0A0A9GE44_ARUDO